MRKLADNAMEYFLARVEKTGTCWNWIGSIDKTLGYGNSSHKGNPTKAHRLSWTIHRGKIPDGLFVLHACDNRRCVNPDHLWIGTQKDNQRDAVNKNRSSRGERNGMAALTASIVKEMRRLYTGERGELTRFSKKYGVTLQAISLAVHGRNWSWVP